MNLRSRWFAVPGFVCIAALATMLSAYSGASSSEGNSPVQPVKFRHTVHVDTVKINCLYCHFAANKSFDPGLPAMSTCMGCHTVVQGTTDDNKAEIKKLASFNGKNEPVNEASFLISDRKSTRLNSSHVEISYAVFCLKKKKKT